MEIRVFQSDSIFGQAQPKLVKILLIIEYLPVLLPPRMMFNPVEKGTSKDFASFWLCWQQCPKRNADKMSALHRQASVPIAKNCRQARA